MQDFLVEVINYIPSYYPFSQKDGSIGLADFYAQEPVYTHNKLHDDPVYRDFKKTCDVIGLPVGPCNKLLSGSNLDCIRTKPPTSPPAPICQSGPGISLPCRCDCSGACLYRSSNASDYIEEWDRDELLALIDSVRKFPEVDTTDDNNTSVDDGYQRMITHELAGNGYWIGLPPSCDGIWVTIVSCDADENGFKGFYKLDAPVFGNNDIELKGRGQRIKIETETPGIYKKYQVYYAYEFEYKLGITPPNDMTFLLADSNIVENAVEDDDPLALNGDTYSYSRFCYDEFVKFTMRNCVAPTDNKGTFGQAPCVCDGEFNTTVNLNDTEKYVLKKDVPERTLEYGVFSIENESTGYCMNGAFERKGSTTGTAESTLPFYQYYDAFSRDTIRWNQINSFNTAWEGEAGGANEDNWYSWEKTEEFDSYTWDSTKVRENCYECLNQKKRQNQRDEVPPCENVMCGRVTINADPDGSVVDAWKALDGPAAGYGNITSNQVKEWDMFSKFGFPTLYSYNPLGLFSDNGKWYDEIKARFVVSGTFIPESTQYTIPCFPTITCPDGQARASSIIDITIPCSDLYNSQNEVTETTIGASGIVHKIYAGTDYRPDEGCRSCAECTPSDCCSPIYGFYEIASSPIGHAFYYPIYSATDNVTKIVDTLSLYDTTLFECYVDNCNRNKLEENYNYCMDNGLMEEGCNCICYAINQCTEDIIENYNEIYNCNPEVNTFDNSLFNRVSAYNWTYAGNPISDCSGGGTQLTVPFSCVYEVKPVRPSSSYWVDVERGQCEVTTETTCGCSVTYQNKRTDPIYFGSSTDSTANTCPVMFCSKCIPGTKSSCSCCGVSRFGSSDGQSQSIYDDCSNCSRTRTNCCPDCCSMCNGNLVDSCGESVGNIDSNWKSEEPCGTTKCGWSYWDYMDCGQKYQTRDRSGNTCQDSNVCQAINCTKNPEICGECQQIYEKIDCDDEFPGDTAGSDNGGFGKDGSFDNGGLNN